MNETHTSYAGIDGFGSDRSRRRRVTADEVIAAVVAVIKSSSGRSVVEAIEGAVADMVGAEWVSVRRADGRGGGGASIVRDGVAARLPLPAEAGVLVAQPERGRPFGVAEFDVLRTGAALAALVMHCEAQGALRSRTPAVGVVAGAPPLVGSSEVMCALRERIVRVARTDFTVIIEGESGAGKEVVARQVHAASARAHGPFVAVNCAALVESLLEAELFGIEDKTATGVRGRRGRFEHAEGGTLFLDEVTDLSPQGQAKLLRVLQERVVERVGGARPHRLDVRVVAATNRPLAEQVTQGRFRPDLFYRLSGVELHVPPLRVRRGDIPELVDVLLGRHAGHRAIRVSAPALEAMATYEWPGNVRELERTIERAIALAEHDHIGVDDLPPAVSRRFVEVLGPALDANESLRDLGARYVRLVLDRCNHRKLAACQHLGITYHTLEAYLRRFDGQQHPRQVGPKRRHRSSSVASATTVGVETSMSAETGANAKPDREVLDDGPRRRLRASIPSRADRSARKEVVAME